MKRRPWRLHRREAVFLIAVAVGLAGLVVRSVKRAGRPAFAPSRGRVRRVVDGDTFDLTNGARIRLLDIDTPEFDGSERERALAQRATDALRELIGDGFRGREVRLERGPRTRDRYGRFLAYCFVARKVPARSQTLRDVGEEKAEGEDRAAASPSVFVNLELVRRGLARVYLKGRPGPRHEEIVTAQAEARAAGRGIWATKAAD